MGIPNYPEKVHGRKFSLTYGAEAVIPTEVNLCSARVAGFGPTENSELMMKQLNLLEERQESSTIQLEEY